MDRAAAAGVTNDRYCKGAAVGDYDNDGDADLYLSNVGSNRLYRNAGELRFTDVAAELGVDGWDGRKTFAAWFFDQDNDGWVDLFVAGFDAELADVAADRAGLPWEAVRPRLFHNRRGAFVDVTEEAGLAHAWLPMGAGFGDVDGDGWLDVYLATGEPDFETLVPNVLLRNEGGARFRDRTREAGLGHLQKGHGVAFADLDHDGDLDLYHQLGGFYRSDVYANALFVNPGHGSRFLVLELVGTTSHPSGAGARVRVVLATPDGPRELHLAPGSVSSFGGAPRRLHVGLGDARAVTRIEVRWPRSGVQTIEDVPLDARVRVVEGRAGFERLTYEPVSFF